MTLSILIASKYERKPQLDQLIAILAPQIINRRDEVEVLINATDYSAKVKRSIMLKESKGKYVWFINDGDWVAEYAVEEVLNNANSDCDIMGLNGVTTTNNRNPVDFQMRVEYETKLTVITGDKPILLLPPTFIAPVKKAIAEKLTIKSKWKIGDHAHTQAVIEKPIYHLRH